MTTNDANTRLSEMLRCRPRPSDVDHKPRPSDEATRRLAERIEQYHPKQYQDRSIRKELAEVAAMADALANRLRQLESCYPDAADFGVFIVQESRHVNVSRLSELAEIAAVGIRAPRALEEAMGLPSSSSELLKLIEKTWVGAELKASVYEGSPYVVFVAACLDMNEDGALTKLKRYSTRKVQKARK